MDLYKSKYSDGKTDGRDSRRESNTRSFRNSGDTRGDRQDTEVTCSDCGNQCTVPFVPRSNKPVYCSDCFRQNKPEDSGRDRYSRDDRGSRNSRDDRGSRSSRDDRGSRNSRDNDREDTEVTCADCGNQCTVPFVPRSNKPVYCSDCFRQNKPEDSGRDRYSRDDRGSRNSRDDRGSRSSRDDRGSRNSRDNDREDTEVTCADCGNQCTVPFVPRSNKPVYCSDCFRQNKPEDSGRDRYSRDDRGSRSSRDDRGSRSSYGRDSSRDRSRSSKNDKLSRKQESLFSNGSDKFYATIKEKLFEILGGKTCSSCGFKDERALGISPISDNANFDSNGRGGEASSWGKYISSPELAKEDLHVLCLNCNEIRQPVSQPKEDRPKPKKSKYFPR